jgi:formylglycine-generating enzyme required for sulfatase activity
LKYLPLSYIIVSSKEFILKYFIAFLYIAISSNLAQAQEISSNLVHIQGGVFRMGSSSSERGRRRDESLHSVVIRDFLLSAHEITQAEYAGVMGVNPSHVKGAELPVESVSWFDAINFCNTLSEKEGLAPAYLVRGNRVIWLRDKAGYRLPSEAEWEFACRANSFSPFNVGDVLTTDLANYYGRKTLPVGNFPANAFGVFDMHGNVWEWCWDGYGSYPSEVDSPAAAQGSVCVLRGGSFRSTAADSRSACRGVSSAKYRSWDAGFRVARNSKPSPEQAK